MVMQGNAHAGEGISRIPDSSQLLNAVGIGASVPLPSIRGGLHPIPGPVSRLPDCGLAADDFRETLNLSYRYENRWKLFDLGTSHPVDSWTARCDREPRGDGTPAPSPSRLRWDWLAGTHPGHQPCLAGVQPRLRIAGDGDGLGRI